MNAATINLAPDYLGALGAWITALLAPVLGLFRVETAAGGEGGDPPAPGAGGAAGGAGAGDGDDDEDETDGEPSKAQIAKFGEAGAREIMRLRAESATHRVKATEATRKLTEREQADMTAAERAEARAMAAEASAAEALTKANDRIMRSEIKAAAATAGAIDPDAVAVLVDKAGITVGDDGEVKGVKRAVEALLKEKPYLKGSGTSTAAGSDMGAGNGDGAKPRGFNDMARQMTGHASQ